MSRGAGPAVTAVVVSYDSGDAVVEAQRSFEVAFAGMPVETVVVDNASRAPVFPPGAIAIRNARNLGFGGGCNVGARVASAPVLLFLNPDARLGRGCWGEVLSQIARNRRIGALGVCRRDPSGEPVPEEVPPAVTLAQLFLDIATAGRRRASRHVHGQAPALEPVRWLPAGCLFVRADVFRVVGGFDESFFLYFEDVDLCERIRRAGYEVVLSRAAEVIHPEAGHGKYHDRERLAHYYGGLATYFAKWWPDALPLVRVLVLVRLWTRALFWTGAFFAGRLGWESLGNRLAGYWKAARAILAVRPRRPSAAHACYARRGTHHL